MEQYGGFPDGFKHLEEMFMESRSQIDALTDQINNLPKDRGYRPEPRPVGAPAPNPATNAYRKEMLIAQRESISKTMMDIAEKSVIGADAKVSKEVLDKAIFLSSTSEVNQMTREQLESYKNEQKETNASQNYAERMRFDAKYLMKDPSINKEAEKGAVNLKDKLDQFSKETELPSKGLSTQELNKEEVNIPKNSQQQDRTLEEKKALFENSISNFSESTDYNININFSTPDLTKTPEPNKSPEPKIEEPNL